jgi:hypothetical protein
MCCTSPADPRTGVLVVRVWRGGAGELCSRILAAPDARETPVTQDTCTGVEATCAAVRSWLEEWAATPSGDPDAPPSLPPVSARDGPTEVERGP